MFKWYKNIRKLINSCARAINPMQELLLMHEEEIKRLHSKIEKLESEIKQWKNKQE